MGLIMSFMPKGLPLTQMLHLDVNTLYNQFIGDKIIDRLIGDNITEFNDFHLAALDIFNSINSALPGKHYDVPSREEVKKCFDSWKGQENKEEKKKVFIHFMKERVNLSKVDDFVLIAGIVTPPVAMVAKRAGEKVPQLKAIKAIPDVLFVPTATVLALVSVKFSRRLFKRNGAS
ncbi:uncharacterized protein LOC133880420 [Alnus glutinosa]|uniref:uncharacterized protein LOC133880420 n=1 Tax=Alnus glutinosa TaxID=3517 RepID=UPI002D77B251|nr:uncharacterized protein LOC133880420 [Alnus glutinosa]